LYSVLKNFGFTIQHLYGEVIREDAEVGWWILVTVVSAEQRFTQGMVSSGMTV
jgi:hypothetical protein